MSDYHPMNATKYAIRVAIALVLLALPAAADILHMPTTAGPPPATSCVAKITGTGTANAIITGSATAVAKLTCS